MGELVKLNVITRVPEPASPWLEKVKEWDCEQIIAFGWDKDGELKIGANFSEIGEALFLIEMAKKELLNL